MSLGGPDTGAPPHERMTMADERPAPGRFIWADLKTGDLDAAKAFYLALFPEWQVHSESHGHGAPPYERLTVDGRGIGGMLRLEPAEGSSPHWVGYVTVADVDAVCAAASAHGGKVVKAPSDIPHVGRYALVADPEGAVFAPFRVLEEGPEHSGPWPVGTFCWYELLARRPEEATAFYTAVLGWSDAQVPTPIGEYHLFRRGERDAAGLLPMPAEAPGPSMWLAYVYVRDVEATLARVKELGGKVLRPALPLPGIGTLAVAADPAGAVFCLFRSERE